ncbi:MAG: type II secretion system F family protein [Desulfobacteraceae bacterium]|nr:type II secretion system F family protein [Desulfobacteraceae bacterium]MBC2719451.1 type II secretion system F family protein [Desulfobacteraceae bacterium]
MTPAILNIPLLISASVFLVLFLFVVAIYQYIRQNTRERELIVKVRESGKNRIIFNEENSSSETEGAVKNPVLNFLRLLGKGSVSELSADYTKTRTRFLRAGLRKANFPALFWGTKFLLAFSLSACFFLGIIFLKPVDTSTKLLASIFLALSGYFLPDIWLHIKTTIRKDKIVEGIPDMLDLLVVCVETGMGLDSAIYRVAQEIRLSHKILGDELNILNLEIRAGNSREKALRNLAERIDIEDVRSLVTLLIQTNKFGTSIAQSLRVYSDSFRTKRYQKAEEIAAKLPVKLMLPLILFIFPSLFVVILGPAAIRLYRVFLRP